MEDIIPVMLFVAIGAISLMKKIVESKNKASASVVAKTPRKAPAKFPLLADFINEITSSPQVTQKKATPQLKKVTKSAKLKADPRKSLIPEESSTLSSPPPLPFAAKIKDSIADSESGKDKPLTVDVLKNNRRFAIICHEVLGNPKALRD